MTAVESQRWYRSALAAVGSARDREDIAQEAVIDTWQRRSVGDKANDPAAFLAACARRSAIRMRVAQMQRYNRELAALRQLSAARAADEERRLSAECAFRELRHRMCELSARSREIVALRGAGYGAQEIQRQLYPDCSERTQRRRYNEDMERLQVEVQSWV